MRPHWRLMTWVVLAFNALMLAIVIGVIVGGARATQCASLDQACRNAAAMGAGLDVVTTVVIWVVFDIILGVIWMVTRGRECPACGRRVRRGVTICKSCDFDIAAAARRAT